MIYGNKVKVNDTFLNVYTEGNKSPTIVFLSGSGVTSPVLEYKPLYRKMSDTYRIAVIEKAGYGLSGSMTTKRTVENLVAESREALKLSGINPPYILAPHSYSGFEAIWWANNYPEEVKAVLGIDMGFPNMALAQAKEISEDHKKKMVQQQRKLLSVIAKQGFVSKLVRNKTVNVSGLMTSNELTDDEKKLYQELFYRNLLNEEISEEALLMTENAVKADKSGILRCPGCFYISSMKSHVKSITWQEAGIAYVKECGGELHLSKEGHFLYASIPDEIAATFKSFLERTLKCNP